MRTKPLAGSRDLLLVDFHDERNVPVADWCPKWAEVMNIVDAAVATEEGNRGKQVDMVREMQEKLARWLPSLPISRTSGVITSYSPPSFVLEPDRGNSRRYTLRDALPQEVLDFLVKDQIEVVVIARGEDAIQLLVAVNGEEGNAGKLKVEDIKLNDRRMLVWRGFKSSWGPR